MKQIGALKFKVKKIHVTKCNVCELVSFTRHRHFATLIFKLFLKKVCNRRSLCTSDLLAGTVLL